MLAESINIIDVVLSILLSGLPAHEGISIFRKCCHFQRKVVLKICEICVLQIFLFWPIFSLQEYTLEASVFAQLTYFLVFIQVEYLHRLFDWFSSWMICKYMYRYISRIGSSCQHLLSFVTHKRWIMKSPNLCCRM